MNTSEFLNSIKPRQYLIYKDYDYQVRWESLQRIAKHICPGFTIDNSNRDIYQEGCRYFAADESCKWDLSKGLYLYGDIGVGKTIFLKIFHNLMKAPGITSVNGFSMFSVNDIIDGYSAKGHLFWEKFNKPHRGTAEEPLHIAIDDLGQSSRIASHYGNQIDVVAELIQRRYYDYTDKYALTHASSNVTPSEIKQECGNFSSSRMREMFNVILFPGSDRRK